MKHFLFLLILFYSCQTPIFFPTLKEIESPSKSGGASNLFVGETGQVYLSWIEYENDTTDVLLFSKLENEKWSTPREIARGDDWFVNWADFPSIVAYKDNGQTLAAHWLQKSAAGTYDYDVRIAQSTNAGKNWNSSFIPHRDSIAAEHGFVSMLPLSENRIFATWLDGRNTKGEKHDEQEHGHVHSNSAMTLRTAVFDREGNLYEEVEIDNRICDCCQTSATLTDKGVIVAYRDRSENEIRDISVVRNLNGVWTNPKTIYNDEWKIAGCPVNGPSIKAIDETVAIAWYSAAADEPAIKVAFSKDSGANFSLPTRIDAGQPLGRVQIELLSKEEALVLWVEKINEDDAQIIALRIDLKGEIGDPYLIANTNTARKSGFPRMVKKENDLIFSWTHVEGENTFIKTGILKI